MHSVGEVPARANLHSELCMMGVKARARGNRLGYNLTMCSCSIAYKLGVSFFPLDLRLFSMRDACLPLQV